MQSSSFLPPQTRLLAPNEALQLLEGSDGLNVQYIPIETGLDWKNIVDPPDHGLIGQIIVMTVKQSRVIDLPGLPGVRGESGPDRDDSADDMDDDGEGREGSGLSGESSSASLTRTNFQVTKNIRTHRYSLVFEFPRGAHFSLRDQNHVFSLFPTRIIQDESEPLMTANGRLGYRWVVTMDPYTVYSNAEAILLRTDPVILPVTHVFPETIGRNNEGRGVKRQRESVQGAQQSLVGKKAH